MMDLATGTVTGGPATILGLQDPEDFAKELDPSGSVFSLQKDLSGFSVVDIPSTKVRTAAVHDESLPRL